MKATILALLIGLATAPISSLVTAGDVPQSALLRAESAFSALGSNPEALESLFDLAARNNHFAEFYLGVAFDLGRAVDKNPVLALDHYRAVADRVREAAFNAGRLHYAEGRVSDAVPYLVVAAGGEKMNGIVKAMVLLGKICERGEDGGPPNFIAAARWYEVAARHKDPYAVGKIGEFLLFGRGRDVNTRDARIYLERAADMWNAEAQYLLGEVFARGQGIPVNRTEAGKWYLVASSSSADFKKQSHTFLTSLNSLERESASKMADLWMAAHPKPAPVDYLAIIERVR